jgi:hypothetical protein
VEKKIYTYRGVEIDTMSREELIKVLEFAINEIDEIRSRHHDDLQFLCSLKNIKMR